MSTHVPGFQSFFRFLLHFVLAKLATSSIMVKIILPIFPVEDDTVFFRPHGRHDQDWAGEHVWSVLECCRWLSEIEQG